MPQFVAPELQGVNEKAVGGPIAPVKDTSAAALIEGIGGAAVEGVKLFARKSLEADMREMREEFEESDSALSIAEINALSAEEADNVKAFQKKVDLLKKASKQTGRNQDFRLRTEVELKKHIANFPGLADEFRVIAGKELGFDPYGEKARQKAELNRIREEAIHSELGKMDAAAQRLLQEKEKAAQLQLKEQEEATRRLLERIDKDAVKLGFKPGDVWDNPAMQAEYVRRTENKRRIQDLEEQKRLSELTGGKVAPPDPQRELLRQASDLGMVQADLASNYVLDKVNEYVGGDLKDISELTPERLARLDKMQRNTIIAGLTQKQQEAMGKYNHYQPDFNSQGWTLFRDTVTGPYTKLIGALDSENILESFQDERKLEGAAIVAGVAGTDSFKKLQALAAAGVPLTNLAQSKVVVDVLDSVTTYMGSTPDNPAASPSAEQMNADVAKAIFSDVKKAIANLNDPSVDTEVIDTAIINYASLLEEGITKDYDGPTMKAIVESLNDPEIKEHTKRLIASHPYLGRSVTRGLADHGGKLARSLTDRIAREDIEETVATGVRGRGGRKVVSSTNPIEVVMDNGELTLTLPKRESLTGRSLMAVELQQRKLEKLFVTPINQLARTYTEYKGVSIDDAWKKLLKDSRYAELVAEPDAPEKPQAIQDIEEFIRQ